MLIIIFIVAKFTGALSLSWWWVLLAILLDGLIAHDRSKALEKSFERGYGKGYADGHQNKEKLY